mmetsp:Transcript_121289/g.258888  ORF Transcript_121289/g.258888 Transcript_121289/m.258888 type:complete len:227 (-) Transcript_121289:14-694(-)
MWVPAIPILHIRLAQQIGWHRHAGCVNEVASMEGRIGLVQEHRLLAWHQATLGSAPVETETLEIDDVGIRQDEVAHRCATLPPALLLPLRERRRPALGLGLAARLAGSAALHDAASAIALRRLEDRIVHLQDTEVTPVSPSLRRESLHTTAASDCTTSANPGSCCKALLGHPNCNGADQAQAKQESTEYEALQSAMQLHQGLGLPHRKLALGHVSRKGGQGPRFIA